MKKTTEVDDHKLPATTTKCIYLIELASIHHSADDVVPAGNVSAVQVHSLGILSKFDV